MVSLLLPAILKLLGEHKSRILLVAQAALPESQFQAFRTVLLDELGKSGFERKLEELLKRMKE